MTRGVVLGCLALVAPTLLAAQENPDRALVARHEAGEISTAEELAAVAEALVRLGRKDPQRFHDALRLYDRAIAADPENLDLQVALGDLFLAKYNGRDARETYDQVLARDPDHPGALLGLARVRRFDGATDVSDLVAQVLEQDAEHVAARLLLARQALDLEDTAAAEREAERALGLDPRSTEAHALLAAAALVAGDEEELRRRLAHAAETVPGEPEIYVILAEVAARNRLYARAVELAGRAVDLDPLSWRGWALAGINRLRTGEIDRGRRDLETAFAGDPFDVWTKNTLDLLDQMADYRTVESGRFELVMPAAEADLLALYLGPLAAEAHDRLAAHYGIELAAPESTPIRLEVFPRHADFSVRTVGLVGLGALGVCFGPVIAMNAPSARPAGDFHWGATLWHELAHSFHLRLSASRVPRWFTEGLAVFEERRARPGWGDRITPEFLIAYLQGRLATVEDLNQGFMRPAYPQQVVFSYLQASLVFDYVVERWGFPAVVAMLEGYGDGKSTAEMSDEVLGVTVKELAEAYDDDFRRRFAGPLRALGPGADAAEPPTPDGLLERADDDPEDFLAHLALGRSLVEDDPEAALPHLERAKGLFPAYAGGDSPYWWLAEAHRKAGRLERAAAELEALTERNRAHYPGLRALAEVRAELDDPVGAAAALENAPYVYPYEMEDHRRLAEWLEASGRPAAAVRERRAVLALDPWNRAEALYRLAAAERSAGDRQTARSTVLEALEQAPNFEAALELLLELRAEREKE